MCNCYGSGVGIMYSLTQKLQSIIYIVLYTSDNSHYTMIQLVSQFYLANALKTTMLL